MDIYLINGKIRSDIDKLLNDKGHAYLSDDFLFYLEDNKNLMACDCSIIYSQDAYGISFLLNEDMDDLVQACDYLLSCGLLKEYESKSKQKVICEIQNLKNLALVAISENLNMILMGD